jgi:small-conductance mechanosensitive channel
MSHNNSLLLQQSLSNESNKNSVVTVSTTIGIPAPKPQQNDRELSKQFIMQLYNQPLYRTSPFSNPSLALSSYAIYSPSHGGHPLYIYPSAQFTSTPIGTTTHPFNTTTTTPNAQLPSQYRIFHSM